MPADYFDDEPVNFAAPGTDAAAVVPSDANDLAFITRGLYVGGAGNVVVQMKGLPNAPRSQVTFSAVPAGTMLPIRAARILATGTTATLMVAVQ